MPYVTHANAALSFRGRLDLAQLVIEGHWPLRRAAERFQVSPSTAKKWAERYRAHGRDGLVDASSAPRTNPRRTPARRERRILALRFNRRWGPHRIAAHLRMARSTVWKVLNRYRMPLLGTLDQATGLTVRRQEPVRYEHETPGDLVHIDIKKQGRIPDGGGHRIHGRASAQNRSARRQKAGYAYLHHAVDDHTRLAYSEILDDERKETAAGFYERARDYFAGLGITIKAVLTDNGSCYRSKVFNQALGTQAKHRYTRPYRPQTNGKVERFNRSLAAEWAYAQSYSSETERAEAYTRWLHYYNYHRPHFGIGGATPISRVHNDLGNYS